MFIAVFIPKPIPYRPLNLRQIPSLPPFHLPGCHVVGGLTFSTNFSSIPLTVWVGKWFEDLGGKEDSFN